MARADVIRWVAIAATGGALAVAAWQLPRELRSYDNAAAAARQRPHAFPVTALVGLDAEALRRAAAVLPRTTTFYVAIPKQRDLADLAFHALTPSALLPRRATLDPAQAAWVVAYRVDPRSLGLRLRRVVPLGGEVTAAEVAR